MGASGRRHGREARLKDVSRTSVPAEKPREREDPGHDTAPVPAMAHGMSFAL
jgi:hypothetical protein